MSTGTASPDVCLQLVLNSKRRDRGRQLDWIQSALPSVTRKAEEVEVSDASFELEPEAQQRGGTAKAPIHSPLKDVSSHRENVKRRKTPRKEEVKGYGDTYEDVCVVRGQSCVTVLHSINGCGDV